MSERFFVLTMIFITLTELLLFLPSVACCCESYLLWWLEHAQMPSLALLAYNMISAELEQELLSNTDFTSSCGVMRLVNWS